jgi:hypothetical protein
MGRELGESLGAALLAGLTAGVERAGGQALLPGLAGGIGGAAVGGSGCKVPHCPRRALAKGLCATHYRKARRLGLGAELGTRELTELAEDGRKTRFAKKK